VLVLNKKGNPKLIGGISVRLGRTTVSTTLPHSENRENENAREDKDYRGEKSAGLNVDKKKKVTKPVANSGLAAT